MAFTYLKVKSESSFVYLLWSCSCYFGFGLVSSLSLGLKNLVLFTSLIRRLFGTYANKQQQQSATSSPLRAAVGTLERSLEVFSWH